MYHQKVIYKNKYYYYYILRTLFSFHNVFILGNRNIDVKIDNEDSNSGNS